ncbi:hypothetical protein [Pelagovum sp. HNIBRBA483]|uniref:hypothetical protein n=1 Tax=Pelagovum sp. HNIBRBA483 TaxID=3233341 RepID=UPI0034A2BAE1
MCREIVAIQTLVMNDRMQLAPDGVAIGRIALPERCANLCFGGRANSRLFMAASHSIYALYVNVAGVKGG